ncbi:MAG: aldehyde dehydrogenase family protein [Deltaproteobacteria bacterium]|nr:MAG: aldehyde dehydrogenase family protein [Deltaproteobacteria bacterium]
MATRKIPARLAVRKTLKMYSGGAFIRSESGRVLPLSAGKGEPVVNVPEASRKDLRNAVVAARKAQTGWAGRTAFNQSQILYRAAEMLEGRRESFIARLAATGGRKADETARREVDLAIDVLVGYAGWPDKIGQVFGGTNPVAAPFFNITSPEALGVVGIVAPATPPLLGLVASIAPVIAGGNTCVVLLPAEASLIGLELGEVLATSDLPGGVVNLLSAPQAGTLAHLAGHADVDGLLATAITAEDHREIETLGAETLKRIVVLPEAPGMDQAPADIVSPYRMLSFLEMKTAWHPIGV